MGVHDSEPRQLSSRLATVLGTIGTTWFMHRKVRHAGRAVNKNLMDSDYSLSCIWSILRRMTAILDEGLDRLCLKFRYAARMVSALTMEPHFISHRERNHLRRDSWV